MRMTTKPDRSAVLRRYQEFQRQMAESRRQIQAIRDANLRRWQGLKAIQQQLDCSCRKTAGRCHLPGA